MVIAVTLALVASVALWYVMSNTPQPKPRRVRIDDDKRRRPRR